MNSIPVCAFGDGEYVRHHGMLEAGFPPTYIPENTIPLCQVSYSVPFHWLDIRFDPDDWCLKGLNGQSQHLAIKALFISSRADSVTLQRLRVATRARRTKEMLFPVLTSSNMKAQP